MPDGTHWSIVGVMRFDDEGKVIEFVQLATSPMPAT